MNPAVRKNRPPRKVIVGTVVQPFWRPSYPGVNQRLRQLTDIVDRMAASAWKKYGRSLDLAVLPEFAVTGGRPGQTIAERALPFAGAVHEAFAAAAQKHHCYIVVPIDWTEDPRRGIFSNACFLIDRRGKEVGVYRKASPAVAHGSGILEGGITPGLHAPVFKCDFGTLGCQICFDMEFDAGWDELARQGVEIVVWPTQSPQTVHPSVRALRGDFFVLSSTWRDNAALFEPTGKIVAQVRPPRRILVEELDLSYMILPWAESLQNGLALRKRFGKRVGFRYYEDEDCGLFWSNDPRTTIGRMAKSIGMVDWHEEKKRLDTLLARAHARAAKRKSGCTSHGTCYRTF